MTDAGENRIRHGVGGGLDAAEGAELLDGAGEGEEDRPAELAAGEVPEHAPSAQPAKLAVEMLRQVLLGFLAAPVPQPVDDANVLL